MTAKLKIIGILRSYVILKTFSNMLKIMMKTLHWWQQKFTNKRNQCDTFMYFVKLDSVVFIGLSSLVLYNKIFYGEIRITTVFTQNTGIHEHNSV
jgi:hypothetical protein